MAFIDPPMIRQCISLYSAVFGCIPMHFDPFDFDAIQWCSMVLKMEEIQLIRQRLSASLSCASLSVYNHFTLLNFTPTSLLISSNDCRFLIVRVTGFVHLFALQFVLFILFIRLSIAG